MLSGGAVLALLGTETTMHVAGAVVMAVPLLLVAKAGLLAKTSRRSAKSSDPDRLFAA